MKYIIIYKTKFKNISVKFLFEIAVNGWCRPRNDKVKQATNFVMFNIHVVVHIF